MYIKLSRYISSVASFLVLGGGGGQAPQNVPTEENKIM